jgi:phosphatidylglycerophosphatase A
MAEQGPKAPRWAWWVATGFGSGYLKPAPGTWGSLAALAVWFGLHQGALRLAFLGDTLRVGVLLALLLPLPLIWTLLSIRASTRVVEETGTKDPGWVVADEWCGQWIALTPLVLNLRKVEPPLAWDALRLVAPFLLFRLFDIWKPGPVNRLQGLPKGLGIVMDDVLAGLFAAVLTYAVDRMLLDWWWVHHLAG